MRTSRLGYLVPVSMCRSGTHHSRLTAEPICPTAPCRTPPHPIPPNPYHHTTSHPTAPQPSQPLIPLLLAGRGARHPRGSQRPDQLTPGQPAWPGGRPPRSAGPCQRGAAAVPPGRYCPTVPDHLQCQNGSASADGRCAKVSARSEAHGSCPRGLCSSCRERRVAGSGPLSGGGAPDDAPLTSRAYLVKM